MSRLQALFQAEDIRDGLKAAAADLRAAVGTLAPMQSYLPADAKEDFTVLERQLASMRLAARPLSIIAAQNLVCALTLDHERANLATPTAAVTGTPLATMSPDTFSTTYSVQSALQTALSESGLASLSAELWLDNELAALSRGVLNNLEAGGEIDRQDPIDAFHLSCAALALLKEAAMDRLYRSATEDRGCNRSSSSSQEESTKEEDAAWAKMVSENLHLGGNGAGGGASVRVKSTISRSLLASKFCLTQKTRIKLETALQSVEKFTHKNGSGVETLSIDDCQGLCQALTLTPSLNTTEGAATNGNSTTHPSPAALLTQYKAAVLLSYAAEHQGYTQKLLAAGAIPSLLIALENIHRTSITTAAATALRTLCRDSTARETAAAAGCLHPLARLLQSPHAGPRRAAARAVGNIIVAGEQFKRDAVEKYSIPGSLIAMLRSDDALGQEAAALAIANLAANSEKVQIALGKTDVFNPLSEILQTAMNMTTTPSMPSTYAAARAVRNLTSRVQFNRLKASAAGTVPGLVATLVHSQDPAGRAIAASALATVMDGCSDAVTQAVHAGGATELLKILKEDSSVACKDAAACALVHIVQANVLQYDNGSARELNTASVGISTSALPALLVLLSHGTPSGRHAAARLIVFLAKFKSKDAVVAAGAVTHLVPLLSAKHDSVRRQAATALCVLMHRCDAARLQLMDAQGLPLIVSLLKKSSSLTLSSSPKENFQQESIVEEGTRQEAARALGILCSNNNFSQGTTAAAAGAITALVNIVREGTESNAAPSTQEAAAVALNNLACLPTNQSALAAARAGQALLRLLHKDAPSSGCRVAAARGLSNMIADGVPNELRRNVSDMVHLLTELGVSSTDEEVKISLPHGHNEHEHQMAAACALGNLACADQHGADAVATYGGAAVLAKLCRSDVPAVREAAVQGLWESCRGSAAALQVAAVEEDVVPWLVQILIIGEDPAKEAAAGCLAELTRCGEVVCAAAEEAGALQLLHRLVDHGSVDVAGAASAALKALQRRSPDSPSLENELSQRLSSLRELGSRRFNCGDEEGGQED